MSIYRPREAASWCEEHASYCARLFQFSQLPIWKAQKRMYLKMRAAIILRHGVECCALPTERQKDQP